MTDPPLYLATVAALGYDPLAPDWHSWLEADEEDRRWVADQSR